MDGTVKQLPAALLPWYEKNKRDLPWRQDKDAYHVWLSEIMLQQTRVEAVKGYYVRFLEKLPTIETLASCDDDSLHKLWEGLGYYSRVRNLKKAAQVIVEQHEGCFPRAYEQVLALPGIGEYTAGAICSICFDQPTPAVDGNVLRVLSRILDDHMPIDLPAQKKKLQSLLAQIYPRKAGDFTQALMELGATLCGPNREPECLLCPCRGFCRGAQNGTARTLPVKTPKKPRKEEDKTVLILFCQDRIGLCRRPEGGLLAGLWQFPDVSGMLEIAQVLETVRSMGMEPVDILRQTDKTHIFTHVRWNMRGVYLAVKQPSDQLCWVSPSQLEGEYALPTAYRQFWEADMI